MKNCIECCYDDQTKIHFWERKFLFLWNRWRKIYHAYFKTETYERFKLFYRLLRTLDVHLVSVQWCITIKIIRLCLKCDEFQVQSVVYIAVYYGHSAPCDFVFNNKTEIHQIRNITCYTEVKSFSIHHLCFTLTYKGLIRLFIKHVFSFFDLHSVLKVFSAIVAAS